MRKKNKGKNKAGTATSINTRLYPDSAGIDVGAEEFVVAVPPDRWEQSVRSFSSFTSGVEELCGWLVACGIKTAAMESTGNYWITLYDRLVASGIDVWLVNARHVKGVPGRKTDVCDAQWLQQLHCAGLLKKSFRPDGEIVPVRFLMRHRREMVDKSSRHLILMQKTLTEMNIKIQHVFSDIDGVSAQNIIKSILSGERDPAKLAALRDSRCRSSQEKIIEALKGDYREEYLFVLGQSLKAWELNNEAIAECDKKIEGMMAKVSVEPSSGPLPPAAKEQQHKISKNCPKMPVFKEGWRFYGVDLSEVPGVGGALLATLMSEMGTGEQILKRFASASHLSSWLGLNPDNRISGGKVLTAKTRKVPSRLAHALRLGVFGLQKSETQMGNYVRKMKARLGKAEGIVAGAHKLIRVIYGMIKTRKKYNEAEAFKISPQSSARQRRKLEKQAEKLGLQLVPA